ncbi:MAG: hypothetical protein U0547_05765 [Dehalococcoidia bacterium]
MQRDGADHVVLDTTGVAASMDIVARFPSIASFCRELGIDIRTTPIPVAPAAHYFMGASAPTLGCTTVSASPPPGKRRAPASTARTASPAIRCWRRPSSGRTAAHIASGSHSAAAPDPHAVAVTPHATELPSPSRSRD